MGMNNDILEGIEHQTNIKSPNYYSCVIIDSNKYDIGLGKKINENAIECIDCERGYKCPDVKLAPIPCNSGYYSHPRNENNNSRYSLHIPHYTHYSKPRCTNDKGGGLITYIRDDIHQ